MKSTRTRAKNDVFGSRRSEPIILSNFLPQFYQGRVCKYAFRWCQRYEAGHVNIKGLPFPRWVHVVTNSATIPAVDELIRQNRRITTHEFAVKLPISKVTEHHIIHKELGYG
ncbi:hypothetical protein AVEN_213905-1 [Araneus ventricosus]|uniref:Mos1 transposase HTH domain-containing protein n=1 Tax=Araneus ventricosus TaxID=182803 RepID=A0A4Y2RYH4_ARAVE|nr:hypothetical protein AVEN_213905-1 [Araneus ventricosus]